MFFVSFLSAQQEAQFTHNMFNIMSFNPGYAGSNADICITSLFREQWVGFQETNREGKSYRVAPQTILFSIEGNVNPLRGGIGAIIYKDMLGQEDNISFKIGYAYRMAWGPGHLGVGIQAGFLNKTIDFGRFFPIEEGDPLLQGGKESDMAFDIALGAYYKAPGQFYAGISSSQLIQSQTSFPKDAGSPKLKRHYFLIGGYYYTLPNNPSIEIIPSLFIKSDFASTQFDVNVIGIYNAQFWGGLTYRPVDAISVLLGARPFANIPGNFETLGIGYSYDITTSAMGAAGRSSGSHEIMLNYCFEIKIERQVSCYKNVRFL